MGRVKAFSVDGCDCWFHTGDHGPAHFHAGCPDEWEIRVFFLQGPVVYEEKFRLRRIPAKVLRSILESAEVHRADLLREWEKHAADE